MSKIKHPDDRQKQNALQISNFQQARSFSLEPLP
jgi:hypothetical protein